MTTKQNHKHWDHIAYHWDNWAAPLRPDLKDIELMESSICNHAKNFVIKKLKAVMWGVTPEIANMKWPKETNLIAVDKSEEMIDNVWPGNIKDFKKAHCSHWAEYPIINNCYDIVIGDGVFSTLKYPTEYDKLAKKAYDLLNKNGRMIIRFFIKPKKTESTEAVLDDLIQNKIKNFHIFKFRLAMSLLKSSESEVVMKEIFDAWMNAKMNIKKLMNETGWSLGSIETINFYKDKDATLSFPSSGEIKEIMKKYFSLELESIPEYEMGERCPIMIFRK